MYVVSVQAHYDSAHYLRNYRGKCERLRSWPAAGLDRLELPRDRLAHPAAQTFELLN